MKIVKNCISMVIILCLLAIFLNRKAEAFDGTGENPVTMGEKLIKAHDALLGRVTETFYRNDKYVFDNQGKFHVDCSYWVGKILERLDTSTPDPERPSPYFNDFPKSSRTGAPVRPRAKDYYDRIIAIRDGAESRYWSSVGHIRDALPGDLIAYKDTDGDVTGNTGHVMIIYSTPRRISDDSYEVYIADATSSPHGSDTRNREGDYAAIFNYRALPNSKGRPSGVGIGKMVFSTPVGGVHTYRWRGNTPGSSPTKAGRDGILAIGRPIETFTVSTVSGFTDAIRPASSPVIQGNTTSFTLFPPSGYIIDQVRGCNGVLLGTTYTTGPVRADCTVEAAFRPQVHTVDARSGAGGKIQPDTRSVEHGQTASFAVSANSGYAIESVGGCNGSLSGNTYATGPISQDCTVVAVFKALPVQTYTLRYQAGANGTIFGPDMQTVREGGQGNFVTALADSGYIFVGWSDGSKENPRRDLNVKASISVSASFALSSFSIMDKDGNPAQTIRADLGDRVAFSISGGVAPEILQIRLNGSVLSQDGIFRQTSIGRYELDILKTGLYRIEVQDLSRKDMLDIFVYPRVGFVSKAQTAGAGGAVSVRIFMDGRAPSYPVRVPFETEGAAWILPENLRKGEIVFDEPQQEQDATQIAALVFEAPGEVSSVLDVDFVLGDPVHAQKSISLRHALTFTPNPQPPLIRLSLLQPDVSMPVTALVQGQGPGKISSHVVRNGLSDEFIYEWTFLGADGRLFHDSGDGSEWILDPTVFPPGLYDVSLRVSNASLGIASHAGIRFRILDVCPDPGAPGDGCGLLDFSENRIPDYLDPEHAYPHRVRLAADANLHAETVPGLRIRPGAVASAAGKQGIQIAMEDIVLYGGPSGSPALYPEDRGMQHHGPVFDFEITDFSSAGQSAFMIIPLSRDNRIQKGSILRIYDVQNGWQTFVEDSRNRIRSAPVTAAGLCPAPAADLYSDGLVEGNSCLFLEIEDGGPNDADRSMNGAVGFSWGLAVALSPSPLPSDNTGKTPSPVTEKGGSGGCMVGVLLSVSH
ncbi:hypothetical protein OOT00_10310 [Desulfobotulus sp. H1]|uniref:Bacterial repeat domain-containing protein n=1 Tax=Desulfobotulus pelophilus TaxID=2823377 RepID=A0ABT3NA91_9BACT|nr:hypothetical protein [Desulfobotulus pelophilus]MCW7754377.1 hypothetical protein [Desulfobotulus pelophilus]